MLTCRECISKMCLDPREKYGSYNLSGCDFCDKPDYYREIENINITQEETPEPLWTKRQWDTVNQLRADNANLREKWYQHLKEDKEYRVKKVKDIYTIT